ncbi:glycosyltransferase [Hyphomicrobium sp. NDB2Meth4]|uniref:glycosyltransferase n=1 Tax=Hyphomicrobium sp. NDB2Meth4 TaxID=1892846 RepID=UPI000930C709|nr:glycosyltransferase [Hyphomicrobium sp. NDB2Meth4]
MTQHGRPLKDIGVPPDAASRLRESERLPAKMYSRRKRIAVILPAAYRGGTLRGAQLLARAINDGSERAGEDADVLFAHLDGYEENEFSDLGPLARRPFAWREIDAQAARRAMRFAGDDSWQPSHGAYLIPDDGVDHLQGCDLWLLVSDRAPGPLLPMKPQIMMVYDYLQRYVPFMPEDTSLGYIQAARAAKRVLVTTKFTEQDALQFAGLDPSRVIKMPMLAPDFTGHAPRACVQTGEAYFLWPTNPALHKNHDVAVRALQQYYERLGGTLACCVSGVDSASIPKGKFPHHADLAKRIRSSALLREKIHWLGELDDEAYRAKLAGAAFLWHTSRVDNGSFSVIEAAGCGVPSLSSDYGPMREIDGQFSLNLAWMPRDDAAAVARQLKKMEDEHVQRRRLLPDRTTLSHRCYGDHVDTYWRVVRQCL